MPLGMLLRISARFRPLRLPNPERALAASSTLFNVHPSITCFGSYDGCIRTSSEEGADRMFVYLESAFCTNET